MISAQRRTSKLSSVLKIGLLAIFTGFLCIVNISSAQEEKKSTPDGIIHSVINAIDEQYLHARANPLGNITRDKLLAGRFRDTTETYEAIRKQLPFLEDPELNVLTPQEIAAVQSEATGEKIGLGLADFCIEVQIESGRARVVTPLV